MKANSTRWRTGFTLIETLVYIGLYTIIIGGMLAAIYGMFESNAHNETAAMLEEEGDYLVGKIDWVLSDAISVGSPTDSGNVLSISRSDGSSVSISATDETMRIKEDGDISQILNNSDVSVTDLTFVRTKLINDGTNPERIAATFTMYATTSDGHVLKRDFSTLQYLRK
jgi:hypothetical protein